MVGRGRAAEDGAHEDEAAAGSAAAERHHGGPGRMVRRSEVEVEGLSPAPVADGMERPVAEAAAAAARDVDDTGAAAAGDTEPLEGLGNSGGIAGVALHEAEALPMPA